MKLVKWINDHFLDVIEYFLMAGIITIMIMVAILLVSSVFLNPADTEVEEHVIVTLSRDYNGYVERVVED